MQAASIASGCQHVPRVGTLVWVPQCVLRDGCDPPWAPSPAGLTGVGGVAGGGGANCNVVHVLSWYPEDDDLRMECKYRAAILFLPQCAVYWHWDRHVGNAGVPGTFRAHRMSWLRFRREVLEDGHWVSYTFGGNGFVRRFTMRSRGNWGDRRPSFLQVSKAGGRGPRVCVEDLNRIQALFPAESGRLQGRPVSRRWIAQVATRFHLRHGLPERPHR